VDHPSHTPAAVAVVIIQAQEEPVARAEAVQAEELLLTVLPELSIQVAVGDQVQDLETTAVQAVRVSSS
jgi:hypothetical protein